MKKLLLFLSCFTAVILMSSCTTDSIETTNSSEISTLEVPASSSVPPIGRDDKDKTHD